MQLAENRSTEIWKGECPAPKAEEAYDRYAPSGSVVLHAILMNEAGEILARTSNWPEPYKLLQLPDPRLKVKVDGEVVEVSVERPCKGLWLDVEGNNDRLEWSDNGVSFQLGIQAAMIQRRLTTFSVRRVPWRYPASSCQGTEGQEGDRGTSWKGESDSHLAAPCMSPNLLHLESL